MDVYKVIEELFLSNGTVNVVIAGITCSGKTTLADKIREYFSGKYTVSVVSQDDYFKNLSDIPRSKGGYLTDSIDAFHTTEFVHDVQMLMQNGVVTMPKYDVATNTRICKNKIVRAGKINIFEGLHTIHLLRELHNCIYVYVDTDVETCLERRVARDNSKFDVPEARIRQYFDDCIKPMSERFIFPQRRSADIIITCKGGESNDS